MNPRYPVYIPSKGRWDSRLTVKAFEAINVPYRIVIEREEYDQYAAVIDPKKILVLPFSGRGLVASRNWIWEHSISEGHKRHWSFDDNIRKFYRLHNNIKYTLTSGTFLWILEEFIERYTNVPLAGMQYELLCPRRSKHKPFILNTRIYSNQLIDNSLKFRWRAVYNDDTDLSLRILKCGLCTVLFQCFLADKMATMRVKGGNTPIYQGNGRLQMAQSLVNQHPDVTTIKWKWHRWQHEVDYRAFKANKLKLKPGVVLSDNENNFGLQFEVKSGEVRA